MSNAPTRRVLDPWRALEALSFYRVTVSVALLILSASKYRPPYFNGGYANAIDACLYVSLFVAALLLIATRGKVLSLLWMAILHIAVDISFIAMLVFASGGISSGLGALMVTPVAAGSLLLQGRSALLPPATATLTLLAIEIYQDLLTGGISGHYTQAGILGVGLFIIAITGSSLARRARESEAKVASARSDLAKLATLSQTVIQKMQAGVLVINDKDQVELLNRAARVMLGSGAAPGRHLSACAPTLCQRLNHWRDDPSGLTTTAIELRSEQSAWAQFTRLGAGRKAATLIVLDDASRVAEQAQSMKLASLGRLTASIAHEIRNPLAAIQHAAELADESTSQTDANSPLIAIIKRQARRLEDIVSNVLKLSRKQENQFEYINLQSLLDQSLNEFVSQSDGLAPQIHIHLDPSTLAIAIDPNQFCQIILNLVQNAQAHSGKSGSHLEISIEARISADGNQALIDISDNGPGIPKNLANHVFEPFFSTRHEGTGLGLFITRELCLAAGGDLQLLDRDLKGQGAYFRLSFPAGLMGIAA